MKKRQPSNHESQRPDSDNSTTLTRDHRRGKRTHVVAWFDSSERPPNGYRRHFDCKPKVGGGVAFFTIYEPINEAQIPTDCTEAGGPAGTAAPTIIDHQDDDGGDSSEDPEPARLPRLLLQAIAARHPGNGASTQCARILEALHLAALTTVDCRRWLDCPHPAQRILELRSLGFNIDTVWTTAPTESGNRHRFALYSLAQQGAGALGDGPESMKQAGTFGAGKSHKVGKGGVQ